MTLIEEVIILVVIGIVICLSIFIGRWIGVNPWFVSIPIVIGLLLLTGQPARRTGRFKFSDLPYPFWFVVIGASIAYLSKVMGRGGCGGTVPWVACLLILTFMLLLSWGIYRRYREKKSGRRHGRLPILPK